MPKLLSILLLHLLAGTSYGWIDAAWPFRRALDVSWAADRATGDELVLADLYTGGAHLPDGSDIRIATSTDRLLPVRLLMIGPGDRIRVAFPAVKGVTKYFAYFGNPKPPPLKAEQNAVAPTAGLMMEMRVLASDEVNSAEAIEKTWQASTKRIGQTIVDHASLGVNPFGSQERTISRFEGILPVGFDGDYVFALSADDRAAIFIDGKPVLFSNSAPNDVRINATVALKEGKRKFVLYHVNTAGDGRFATAYRRAENQRWQPLGAESFGRPMRSKAGPLEQLRKTLVADFDISYQGEAFFAGGYSHRYQFTAYPPAVTGNVTYEWDFGNGRTASGAQVTQVYLADGEYAVRLTARIGNNTDTRTHRISVHRDWEWTDRPTEEPIERHALMLADHAVGKMPENWLPRAALLFVRTQKLDSAQQVAARLAAITKPVDPDAATAALTETTTALVAAGQTQAAIKLWQAVPATSTLQPNASLQLASLQLWREGDAAAAARTIAPHAQTDPVYRRLLGQSLLLAGNAAEGRKVLESIAPGADPARQLAISGASARTVEFYITTKDTEAGANAWELWQQRYPADFLQGYALLLKVKLMELDGAPVAAAKVAEGFARAMPTSSYSPQLLDRAAKLLQPSDPSRSNELRKLLKERYPEDPLAQ